VATYYETSSIDLILRTDQSKACDAHSVQLVAVVAVAVCGIFLIQHTEAIALLSMYQLTL